jgi:hypothetical protein
MMHSGGRQWLLKTTITITNVLSPPIILQTMPTIWRITLQTKQYPTTNIRQLPHVAAQHVFILDIGGGTTPTIAANAWKITHRYNVTMPMSGAVVNTVTKVEIPGEDLVIFEVHYATLIKDEDEFESLLVPFEIMKHAVKIDMIPPKYGGTGSILVDGETLPFMFDNEKLYWEISMPTCDDMDTLKWFELNPPALLGETHIRCHKQQNQPHHILWEEWHRCLAMLPEDVVKRTVLEATTQLYMEVENENRNEPREHYKSLCPGLRSFRQHETVASYHQSGTHVFTTLCWFGFGLLGL